MFLDTQLGSQLPGLYSQLLPPAFLKLKAVEKKASCSNCYMCRPVGKNNPVKKPFEPSTKCCTYYPFVPNYLVGGMLLENGEAAKHMRTLIRDRQWILPIGVVAPPSYQVKFQDKHMDDFGRDADLMCPFYKTQSGQCGIWQWRDSQCSTYFCTYDNEKTGPQFWLSVQQFLYDIEMLISQECMLQKGFSAKEIEENLNWVLFEQGSQEVKPYIMSSMDWSQFWQHHYEDIEAYFIACYKLVLEHRVKFKNDIDELHEKYSFTRTR